MTSITPNPAYRINTEHLVLRCWAPTDAPQLRAALDASASHLRPWIPFMKDEPRTLAQTTQWLREIRATFDQDEHYRYGVFASDDTTVLGEVMLLNRAGPNAREIGYWMDVRHAGKGYATEASGALVQVAFLLDRVERVELHCSPDNAPSVAIAKKLGFRHEATLPARFRDCDDKLCDTMVWTLFAADYPGSAGSALSIECYDALGRRLAP